MILPYFKKRFLAFGYAFSGLFRAFMTEAHLKIFFVAALLVISSGFYFGITKVEWLAVLGCIALVVSLELINSAIEKLCDLVIPEQHPKIKYIKDVMAAAVLVACVFSAMVGICIFWPYFER